jgi:hypothetical protein
VTKRPSTFGSPLPSWPVSRKQYILVRTEKPLLPCMPHTSNSFFQNQTVEPHQHVTPSADYFYYQQLQQQQELQQQQQLEQLLLAQQQHKTPERARHHQGSRTSMTSEPSEGRTPVLPKRQSSPGSPFLSSGKGADSSLTGCSSSVITPV